MYHGAKKESITRQLADLDIVLSTLGTELFGEAYLREHIKIHRLIIDECHQAEVWQSNNELRIKSIDALHIWGVTGTPLSSSINDLRGVAELIGQWNIGLLNIRKWYDNDGELGWRGRSILKDIDATLVPVLKRLMIRHTKSQRIGGEVALALPDASAVTVWLDMGLKERRVYSFQRFSSNHRLLSLACDLRRRKTPLIEIAIARPRQACAGAPLGDSSGASWSTTPLQPSECTKLKYLLNDLDALRAKEPALHAVVFNSPPRGVQDGCSSRRWASGSTPCEASRAATTCASGTRSSAPSRRASTRRSRRRARLGRPRAAARRRPRWRRRCSSRR